MLNLALTQADVLNLLYLLAAVLFIIGLKMLGSVKTAVRGNQVSALGMLLAICATFVLVNERANPGQSFLVSFAWIAVSLVIGGFIGVVLAKRTPMTGMPQMVAMLNGFGGIASLLVAMGDYYSPAPDLVQGNAALIESLIAAGRLVRDGDVLVPSWNALYATGLAVLIGGVTFTGSLVAFGKLQGLKITPSRPVQFPGQKFIIVVLLVAGLSLSGLLVAQPPLPTDTLTSTGSAALLIIAGLSLLLGILLVIGIGGADMPVVVSLLNSYSGIAAAMAGFVLGNMGLIITGALVGASGIILTNIMCKAMNRSLANVLFGGVGGAPAGRAAQGAGPAGNYREQNAEDVAIQLSAARQVMIVPGYGMAVAQAQHSVKDLAELLEERGCTVYYAIHPVAGRMPGHMNVLLAEADVPYESLLDLEGANAEFEQTDLALVIGANDVTNPAARHAESSPIYGMPILDVDKARSVVVIKRSMNPGFAGVENELYYRDNCSMLFGDGKAMVNALVQELRNL